MLQSCCDLFSNIKYIKYTFIYLTPTIFTDKVYGLLEVWTDVCRMAVLHRNPFVVVLSFSWPGVPARDVQQRCYAEVIEIVLSAGMIGTAQVQERQDLHRPSLHE